jgi:dipeptidyl aminopeptidase/acylaminoacyl peptidase
MIMRVLLALTLAILAHPAFAADASLLAREKLFGNPSRIAALVSPDGQWASWLAPHANVMNIWIAPLADPQQARLLTRDTARSPGIATWAHDGRHLLYLQDRNGDGNTHLYAVDRDSGVVRDLTPIAGARAAIVGLSPRQPDHVLISMNRDDPKLADLYRLDLRDGTLTLVLKNPGYLSFLPDGMLVPRFAVRREISNGLSLIRLSDNSVFLTIPAEDVRTTSLLSLDSSGKSMFLLDSRGRDKVALTKIDLATGRETVLASDPRADIERVTLDPRSREPIFYDVTFTETEHRVLAPQFQADIDLLNREAKGTWRVDNQSSDGNVWKVTILSPTNLGAYVYDRPQKRLTKLYDTRPDLVDAGLVGMQSLVIKSRNDQDLVSYLSLPAGSDRQIPGRPDTPLPLLLSVHGGPHSRDLPIFNPDHQWAANRGYAVLSVNMRGSTGFGKAFLNASAGEWGARLDDDLTDAVQWAIRNRIADPARIAIMGYSYGGYAVLRGMTRNPELYACGVDMYGASDLTTMQGPGTTYGVSALNYNEVGDGSTPEGVARMREQSPLFHVDRMRRPLLVAQGANDPGTRRIQSDQMVAAMKAAGLPVTYLLFPDEGHGFVRPENNLAFYAVAEQFLGRCLGGRTQPLAVLSASSMQVLEGAGLVPGLSTALAREQAGPSPAAR